MNSYSEDMLGRKTRCKEGPATKTAYMLPYPMDINNIFIFPYFTQVQYIINMAIEVFLKEMYWIINQFFISFN